MVNIILLAIAIIASIAIVSLSSAGILCLVAYVRRERHGDEERLNRHSDVTFDRKVHKVERRTDR